MITAIESSNILHHAAAKDIVLITSRQGQADPLERTLLETLELDYKHWGTLPDLSGSPQQWEVRSFEIFSCFPRRLHTITGVLHPNRFPAEADMPEHLIDLGDDEPFDIGPDTIHGAITLSRLLMGIELPKILNTIPGWYVYLVIGFNLEGLSMPFDKLSLPTSRIQCEAAARAEKQITLIEHRPARQSIAPLSKLFRLFGWGLSPSCRSAFG